ncbi:MAG: PleD family two-component system response regulator [Pyrinomonadaceae bacterium]
MLAGRKLLLADDSITIQKVVDLTFADEGVDVVCVNNGREAIERLEEFIPDVVLADVYMPQMNGYEVCEYIKQNEKLKNIPVMLLVGSFEPFDETEARRVGADDILTKPFQSIRRLIDKVGTLVGGRPAEEQIPTAELPRSESTPEPAKLSPAELAMTTADTLPLSAEHRGIVKEAAARANDNRRQLATDVKVKDVMMSNKHEEGQRGFSERHAGAGDMLLDLGDYQPARSVQSDEFVLDIDLNEAPESAQFEAGSGGSNPVPSQRLEDPFATTRDLSRGVVPVVSDENSRSHTERAFPEVRAEGQAQHLASAGAPLEGIGGLSPETLDAIARRAVEHLSERVIQEIAWEVVPQLAELLIKRQLEEKNLGK